MPSAAPPPRLIVQFGKVYRVLSIWELEQIRRTAPERLHIVQGVWCVEEREE